MDSMDRKPMPDRQGDLMRVGDIVFVNDRWNPAATGLWTVAGFDRRHHDVVHVERSDGSTEAILAGCVTLRERKSAAGPERGEAVSGQGDTVTVTRHGQRFKVSFSRLPGRTFGPWDLAEAIRDLTISALLEPVDARDLVMEAGATGSAARPVGGREG